MLAVTPISVIEALTPVVIALVGGAGFWKWLSARQAPTQSLQQAFEAERDSMERRFAEERDRLREQMSKMQTDLSDLTAKVEHLQGEADKAWRRVGVLEGVLGENGIPIPNND